MHATTTTKKSSSFSRRPSTEAAIE
jgi:hypothetical protein